MRIAALLLVCSVILAACGSTGGKGGGPAVEFATACMFEVDAPGAYVYNDGDAAVSAGGGGTAEGAAALNACIQKKVAAAGQSAAPAVAGGSQRFTTEVEGATVRQTFTYGTPPATAPVAAKPVQSTAPTPQPSAAPSNAPGCRKGGGTMQGGTSYCIGY